MRRHPRGVKPDIHNAVEVPGNNSQEDPEKGDWEPSSDEAEELAGSEMSGSEGMKCDSSMTCFLIL